MKKYRALRVNWGGDVRASYAESAELMIKCRGEGRETRATRQRICHLACYHVLRVRSRHSTASRFARHSRVAARHLTGTGVVPTL